MHFKKYGLQIRLAEESDAAFILRLRTDISLSRHIHFTDSNIENQKLWIREYKKREQAGIEFYFIFSDSNGIPLGVSRIYNITPSFFTIGSWIFIPTAPQGSAILGDIICREFAFEKFDGKDCHFEVRKENKTVLKYHHTYSPEFLYEEGEDLYFKLSYSNFERQKKRYLKLLLKK